MRACSAPGKARNSQEQLDHIAACAIALSADGGRLAVGAHRNDGTGADSGHARVYDVCSTTTSRRLTEEVHGPVTRAFYSWTQRQFATP